MELDDLKSAWAQHDKKLTEALKWNEELLRGINLEKSKNEMNSPLYYEIVNTTVGSMFLIYLATSTFKYIDEPEFFLPGLIAGLTFAIFLCLSIIKIRLLSSIDFYYSPVLQLQKSLTIFKQKYLYFKKYELYALPVFLIALVPILGKALRNTNVYTDANRYIITIVLVLALYYPMANWIYKNWFDKKLRNTFGFLEELKKFEKES